MKLLIITHNFPPRREISRNAGSFIFGLALALSKLGLKIYVLMPETGEGKEDYPEFKVTWFPWRGSGKELRRFRWYRPGDLLNLLSLMKNGLSYALRLIESEAIDYCSAMWIIPSGFIAYKVKRKFGVPYSVWVLGADIWTYGRFRILRPVMKRIVREAHKVLANSHYLNREMKKLFQVEGDILYAIRSLPLDIPKAAISNRYFNFLFIGRYERVKGLDVLLRAFRILWDEGKEAHLHIFGGGELENYYRKMIDELNLSERVYFGGYASPETTVSFMKACSCLVIPSRQESQPVILMDAIQVKIPVIVTKVGDMGEIVEGHHIGLVVEAENVWGLKKAMVDFMEDKGLNYRANLEKLSPAFTISSMAKKYLEKIASHD